MRDHYTGCCCCCCCSGTSLSHLIQTVEPRGSSQISLDLSQYAGQMRSGVSILNVWNPDFQCPPLAPFHSFTTVFEAFLFLISNLYNFNLDATHVSWAENHLTSAWSDKPRLNVIVTPPASVGYLIILEFNHLDFWGILLGDYFHDERSRVNAYCRKRT